MARASPIRLMEEVRLLLGLAWPAIITNLSWAIMQAIDVSILGHLGADELGVLGGARTLFFLAIVIGISAISGVSPYTSYAFGARDESGVSSCFRSGLTLSVIVGCAGSGLLIFFPAMLLSLLGISPDLVVASTSVVVSMAIGLPALMIASTASMVLEATGRPVRITIVNLALLPVNTWLAWKWSGGIPGLPGAGPVGVAAATSVSIWMGAAILVFLAWRAVPPRKGGLVTGMKPWSAEIGRLARFGLPPALAAALQLAGVTYLTSFSTRLGSYSAAAFQIILSVQALFSVVFIGLAVATGVRVGLAYGARDTEMLWYRARLAAGICCLSGSIIALLCFAASRKIAAAFSEDATIIPLAASALEAITPYFLAGGLQAVFGSVLLATGNQITASVNNSLAVIVTISTGYAFVSNGFGVAGLAMGLGSGAAFALTLHLCRIAWASKHGLPALADV
ncbi:MATE family efflux transporter [Rhizorhapis suberifaciens]|uniref:MATE family efflux transporter n=1 Tax=Rhizorhapis suberifaciens TaxID=13656 RepID=UPI002ADDB5CE|nr:MATE family efflux transporter [Rhizorhapis suberifaciens]